MRVKIDIKAVRTPAIVTVVSAVLCYASLQGSVWFREVEEKELKRQQQAALEMTQKFRAAAGDVQQIDVYYPRFKDYKAQEIIGTEDRVLWVENLIQQAQGLYFISLTFSISPPEVVTSRLFGPMVGADLYGSTMSVDMGLLHEEKMMELIAGLQTDAKGLFSVNECSIERKGKEGRLDQSGEGANFTGRCQLMWFNIKGRKDHWGESS